MGRPGSAVLAAVAIVLASFTAACSGSGPPRASEATSATTVTVGAAGDIACEKGGPVTPRTCQQKATSDLLLNQHLDAVLTLGDEQYVQGRLSNFQSQYGPTWGRLLSVTHPAPGNHEYLSGADGYYRYFGKAAGDPKRPYYSFDLGAWHIVALNSECAFVGGCGAGSPQERWLVADLAQHPTPCTLAFWHRPRFSSGGHGNDPAFGAFWKDLYAAGAEIVLNGHDHDYERFLPQTPNAAADDQRGITEFVVGTGGKDLRTFHDVRQNSAVRSATFGVLLLTLRPKSYDWRFAAIPGSSFTDSGHGTCH